MDNKSRGLGKGLDALFESSPVFDTPIGVKNDQNNGDTATVSMYLIDPNPNQPRADFNKDKLSELAESIREHGILQPILLKPVGKRYLLVAGERRFRAAKKLGLEEIPAIIKELDDEQVAAIALIENLQRDNLNPIEEALGIKSLMDEFGWTQEDVSIKIGKSRPAIANTLRLLKLPDFIANYVAQGRLTSGHGRCLASISNPSLQRDLALRAMKEELSVRQLEQLVKEANSRKEKDEEPLDKPESKAIPEFTEFRDKLQKGFGMKVDIKGNLSKGKITMSYSSRDELESLYELAKKINK